MYVYFDNGLVLQLVGVKGPWECIRDRGRGETDPVSDQTKDSYIYSKVKDLEFFLPKDVIHEPKKQTEGSESNE